MILDGPPEEKIALWNVFEERRTVACSVARFLNEIGVKSFEILM